MQHFIQSTKTFLKTRTLGLALVALLSPLSLNLAQGSEHRRPVKVTSTSGHVEVVHQIPGGIIVVGVDFGRSRPVHVENRRTVVVEKKPCHRHREVTIVREVPRREVTVIKTVKHGRHGKHNKHRDTYACR